MHAFNTYNEFKNKYPMPLGSISSTTASNALYDGCGDALLLEDADLVGIQRPKEQLLNWISLIDDKLRVVAVVGKTTLCSSRKYMMILP